MGDLGEKGMLWDFGEVNGDLMCGILWLNGLIVGDEEIENG